MFSTLKRSPMRRQSKKARRRQRRLAKLVQNSDGLCALRIEGICTYWAEGSHHPLKRRFRDDSKAMPSCNACNGFVERFPAKARAMGLSVLGNSLPLSRFRAIGGEA